MHEVSNLPSFLAFVWQSSGWDGGVAWGIVPAPVQHRLNCFYQTQPLQSKLEDGDVAWVLRPV